MSIQCSLGLITVMATNDLMVQCLYFLLNAAGFLCASNCSEVIPDNKCIKRIHDTGHWLSHGSRMKVGTFFVWGGSIKITGLLDSVILDSDQILRGLALLSLSSL